MELPGQVRSQMELGAEVGRGGVVMVLGETILFMVPLCLTFGLKYNDS